uniref:Peptidase_M28 domain-containing protein n=1 Tax=Steinernema glaseri TaxID=37863 RepID=A0A1I7YJI4_9BILA
MLCKYLNTAGAVALYKQQKTILVSLVGNLSKKKPKSLLRPLRQASEVLKGSLTMVEMIKYLCQHGGIKLNILTHKKWTWPEHHKGPDKAVSVLNVHQSGLFGLAETGKWQDYAKQVHLPRKEKIWLRWDSHPPPNVS